MPTRWNQIEHCNAKVENLCTRCLNLLASRITASNVDEDTESLLLILALDQRDIDAGSYRDVGADELDSNNLCGHETVTTA
jgi:hypothetical protein